MMTAQQVMAIFLSRDFQQDLEEMSSYLASIKQERPIVFCLARHLWRQGQVFRLEAEKRDLVIGTTQFEFKYSFDCDMTKVEDELSRYRDRSLDSMWNDALAKKISMTWAVLPVIYKDVVVKKPDVFVWVICSRDLSGVDADTRKRICWSTEQWKWSQANPYSNQSHIDAADKLLGRLREIRPFSIHRGEVVTNGWFPSTYHFRVCDFLNPEGHAP